MRLICPNCDAEYEVDAGAIPAEGRDVQCSACGHTWFQPSPEQEADLEEEDAIFGAAPPDGTVETSLPKPQPPASAPPRSIDETVLNVLREEAARESERRRAEAMEVQPDLGLAPQMAATAPVRSGKREMLPEIDAINSTLRAKGEKRAGEAAAVSETMPQDDTEAAGFRKGFVIVLVLAALLVTLYVAAPSLAARFPVLAPVLSAYMVVVDNLRAGLDRALQNATSAISGWMN